MLTSKVTRAAQRFSSGNTVVPASCTPYLSSSRTHQRRRSSSKASCPPDSSNKPAPASKPSATVSPPTSSTSQSLRTKRAGKSRRLAQDKSEEYGNKYESLPFVPQLHHLGEQDFGLSSFFALHRPLSITTPLPAPVTEKAFNAIFDTQIQSDPWTDGNSAEQRPEDVIYALSKTIETIEEASNAAHHDILRVDVAQESTSNAEATRHLDGTSQMKLPSLEEIIAQAKPYQVPPPPQAFPTASQTEKKRASRANKQTATRTKSYTTTITVVESEDANGDKTYEASASPIVRLPDSAATSNPSSGSSQADIWTSYKTRRRDNLMAGYLMRRPAQRSSIRDPQSRRRIQPNVRKSKMLLISVKRQRKLKMKKHKYKKLMRRTRNLRRRLEKK